LTAEVFADTSMINSPTSFTFTSDYISNGELKTDTSTLGAYVSGDINLVLYDVEVNKIGDSLYVVGNVLNQGSTTGKFANIALTSFLGPPSQGNPQTTNQEILAQNNPEQKLIPQYLGDLTEDSVIPFSIPLSIPVLSSGIYPLTFKITYADDLKNFHEIVLEKEVNVNQILQVSGENQGSRSGSSSTMSAFVILGLTGVLIASVVFVVKKKKFSKLKLKNDNNFEDDDYIENLLDSATEENQQQKNNVK
jgi:hypothetical protein